MTASWQLVLLWGVLVGVGTGSISMGFVATVATRWFEARRGLVTGVLTAASATGQLIFLPVVAQVTDHHGWRWASLIVAAAALAVVPLVAAVHAQPPAGQGPDRLRRHRRGRSPPRCPRRSFRAAFDGLLLGARVPAFWLLAASFAICGMTTNGLIGTHFIPAANDHGMPTTVAAGLLAIIGILDVAGTVFSGWLTDRVDPRLLLVVYYTGRGVSLLLLPSLLSPHAEPSTWVFVIFYGLDWVATVPPTIVLCRNYFGAQYARSCSAGCSPRTSSARRSPPRGPANCAICRATTTSRSTSPQASASLQRRCVRMFAKRRSAPLRHEFSADLDFGNDSLGAPNMP